MLACRYAATSNFVVQEEILVIAKGKRAFRSWMFIYAGLVATVAFANPGHDSAYPDSAELSPVALETAVPALKMEAITDRSDI